MQFNMFKLLDFILFMLIIIKYNHILTQQYISLIWNDLCYSDLFEAIRYLLEETR